MPKSYLRNLPLKQTLSSNSEEEIPSIKAVNDALDTKQASGTYATGTGTANGTNTGDETTSTIKTKLGTASASTEGYLTSTDWNTFNNKLSSFAYTPENNANKSDSYTVSSSATYSSTKALVDGLATKLSMDKYLSGYWDMPLVTGTTTGTGFNASAYFIPFIVSKAFTFTDIGVIVSTGVAAATVRVGVYNSSGNAPSTVAFQSGALDASTTGLKSETLSSPVTLQPGLYWRVVQTSALGVGLRYGQTLFLVCNPADSASQSMRVLGRAYGAFTDNPATSFTNAVNGVYVLLKVQ